MRYLCTITFLNFDSYLNACGSHIEAAYGQEKPGKSINRTPWGLILCEGTAIYSGPQFSLTFPVLGNGSEPALSEPIPGLQQVQFEPMG